ncbi:MAG: MFS transporter [Deltaproteobacteria bacterium]|nr:MFS transporter [Deltaproteobacteria bacterium]
MIIKTSVNGSESGYRSVARPDLEPGTKLTTPRLIAFAMPSFAMSLLYGPVGSILPTIYAKYYALDLAFIGSVLMVSRIFDAVSDPVIGFLSDRTRTPLGNRKPWIIAGYGLTLIAVYHLFLPPDTVQPMYFMIWFILLYQFLTVSEIPYQSWQAEITRDYRIRSKVVSVRAAFGTAGGLLFAVAPLLPIFETHEMTPAVMKLVALILIVLLPISVCFSVVFAPQGKAVAVKKTGSVINLIRDFKKSKPFLIFTAAFLFVGLASGMQQILGFLYFDTYLGIGDKFPIIFLSMSITQLLAIPVWFRIMNKISRHRALAVGTILSVFVSIALMFLRPGPSVFPVFMVIWICMLFLAAAVFIVPPAMMADVIDYDILKSGSNRTGQYYAVFTMIVKANVGLGGGLGFFIVDLFGYDAASRVHAPETMMGIWIAVGILPSIFYIISSIILWRFPIDERRQDIIRRRIEMRSERMHRTEQ